MEMMVIIFAVACVMAWEVWDGRRYTKALRRQRHPTRHED
jgi:hypothetical protein